MITVTKIRSHPDPYLGGIASDFWGHGDHLVINAFRYCLGRTTYAPMEHCMWLKEHWCLLLPHTRSLIQHEIVRAIEMDRAGHESDIQTWRDFLLYTKENLCSE